MFEIDVLVCEQCGGRREILAFLTEPPPIAPARSPPELPPLFA